MRLFKEKNAEQLQESLMKLVDDYARKLNLREEVEQKVAKTEKHIKFGLYSGLGLGAIGVVGGIGTIAAAPAIATIAIGVAGFTAAGAAIMGGGAALAAGLGYAGIGQLIKKIKNNSLGSDYAQASEKHRLEMVDLDTKRDFNIIMHRASSYTKSAEYSDVYDIQRAVVNGDFDKVKELVKKMAESVEFKDARPALKIEPVQNKMTTIDITVSPEELKIIEDIRKNKSESKSTLNKPIISKNEM